MNLIFFVSTPTPLYANKKSAIKFTKNLEFYKQRKHIAVESYDDEVITIPHISSQLQIVNQFSDAMSHDHHNFSVSKLMLLDNLHQFVGKYGKSIDFSMPMDRLFQDTLLYTSSLNSFERYYCNYILCEH